MNPSECNAEVPSAPSAALLTGGRSRRFGSDKARVCVDGVALIQRNHNLLANDFSHLAVVGPPANTYADLGITCVPDDQPHRGPMAGVIAALRERLATRGPGAVAVCACDTVLTTDASQGLHAIAAGLMADASRPFAAAGHDGARWQPLVAAYHTRALVSLQAALDGDRASLTRWLDDPAHRSHRVTDPPAPATFNTPEELARLSGLAGTPPSQ